MGRRMLLAALIIVCLGSTAGAQNAPPPQQAPTTPPPPPATKLEAFQPTAGTLTTKGYNEISPRPALGLDVYAQELRNIKGQVARGLTVDVTQSEYRQGISFVDADEIPELLKGIDALLAIVANPTSFKNYEVRYRTRGELELVAFNSGNAPDPSFAIYAGRVSQARKFINRDTMIKFRAAIAAAEAVLNSTTK